MRRLVQDLIPVPDPGSASAPATLTTTANLVASPKDLRDTYNSISPLGDSDSYQPMSASPADAIPPPSPVSLAPKSVAFELLFTDSPQSRARLPMRVQIYPHDTTDSIVTTVKNFYGLYNGPAGAQGVSFEDEQGHTLIARYENLRHHMVVYVRVIQESPRANPVRHHAGALGDARVTETFMAAPPHPAQALTYGQPVSRPGSRTSHHRSESPHLARGRRSESAASNPSLAAPVKMSRSRSGFNKSRGSSTHAATGADHLDAMNGYSSGDGAAGSVSSKAKSEHLGTTEISLDNIVEGGRRKRAKFESSVSRRGTGPELC